MTAQAKASNKAKPPGRRTRGGKLPQRTKSLAKHPRRGRSRGSASNTTQNRRGAGIGVRLEQIHASRFVFGSY